MFQILFIYFGSFDKDSLNSSYTLQMQRFTDFNPKMEIILNHSCSFVYKLDRNRKMKLFSSVQRHQLFTIHKSKTEKIHV